MPLSFYQFYELNHAAMAPWRAVADAARLTFQNPLNPFADTPFGRSIAAAAELFERTTRRYGKPDFGLKETEIDGRKIAVHEETVWQKPFCSLQYFRRDLPKAADDPKLLIVAPLSGHYATLLRGTVEAMLPEHEVFITDWADARMVPVSEGTFDLDDYIDYLIEIYHHLGPNTHVMAVCQPSVPVLASVALLSEDGDPDLPCTMTLMGGPIDTRLAPTAVNQLAEARGTQWFRNHTIMTVPFPHPGFMRKVYPGFLQLSGFMSMNFDRHVTAHQEFYQHLVDGDGNSADKHREFYDEYLAVMDLTAEFYLQTVETVFVKHLLPNGLMTHRERPVRTEAIRHTALQTVEGERDDISGVGQTKAAHALCTNLSYEKKQHYLAKGVGHYGVFNGSRYRSDIQPRIRDFIRKHHAGSNGSLARAAKPINGKSRHSSSFETRFADAFGFTALSSKSLPAVTKAMANELTEIAGVGPKMAAELNKQGIFDVGQLAEMAEDAMQALDVKMNGRPSREDWFGQAKKLAESDS